VKSLPQARVIATIAVKRWKRYDAALHLTSRSLTREKKSASPIPEPTPKWTKKSKKKAKRSPSPSPAVSDDVSMPDASILPEPVPTAASTKAKTVAAPSTEDFSAIYLRKITTELADDLDTVREAQDFKANSVPMLIHALKQGENMFSVEERIRIIGAVGQ
jgi:ribosome assembly protein 3